MSGQDLMQALEAKINLLDEALRQLKDRGFAAAQAERAFRVALRQKILVERDRGTPVTIIADVCMGDEEVARLRFQRDASRALYDAAKEACNVYKLEIRLLDEQISREFRG